LDKATGPFDTNKRLFIGSSAAYKTAYGWLLLSGSRATDRTGID